jgi:hypothetical protein
MYVLFVEMISAPFTVILDDAEGLPRFFPQMVTAAPLVEEFSQPVLGPQMRSEKNRVGDPGTTTRATVSLVVPETLPRVAVIVEKPVVSVVVASPELLIVATLVLEELQVTEEVMSSVELSEYVPRAVN